jgi:outer membrane immunogenic protein
MKRALVIGAALIGMIAGPAFAADMPVKALPPPPVVPTWTGFYLGAEVGDEWSHADWNPTCIQIGGPITCGTTTNAALFPGAPDSAATFTATNVRYGIYSGWMFQAYERWGFGAESDYAFHSATGSVNGIVGCVTAACTGGFATPPFSGDSTTLKLGDDYAVRLRAGFLVIPQLQLYVAGGPAAQHVSATLTCSATGAAGCAGPTVTSFNETWLVGYTIGGGLEWKVWDHLLLRAEYRFNDYGTWKQSGFFGAQPVQEFADVHVKSQMANVGIAWQFSPPTW